MSTLDTPDPADSVDPAAERMRELVDRYVRGRMSPAEQEVFERRLIENEDLALEVALTQRLRMGLRRLSERGELARWAETPRKAARGHRGLALAACVLIALAAGFFLLRPSESPSPVWATSLRQIDPTVESASREVPTFFVAHTRSTSETTRIAVSRKSGPIRLRILTDAPANSAHYSATLRFQQQATRPAAGPALEVDSDAAGFVSLFLDTTRAEPGHYEIELAQSAHVAMTTPARVYAFDLEIAEP